VEEIIRSLVEAYEEIMKEDERLACKLNMACNEDKTGQFERILRQAREGKSVH